MLLAADFIPPPFPFLASPCVPPKVCASTLKPIEWPANPDQEWCPPGHGDLYAALAGAGPRLQSVGPPFQSGAGGVLCSAQLRFDTQAEKEKEGR